MPKIRFLPLDREVECAPGETVFAAAKAHGVEIASTCGQVASCGLCRVKIVAGAEHLSRVEFAEQRLVGNTFFISKERLACQTQVSGDVTVELPAPRPPENDREAERARRWARERAQQRKNR